MIGRPKPAPSDPEPRDPLRASRGQRGFTLVEIMVAVTILIAVVASLYGTFFRTRNEMSRIGNLVDSRQSARATLQLIERDVRMSGSGWGKMVVNVSRNGTPDSLFGVNPGPGAGDDDSLRIVGAWSTATTTTALTLYPTSAIQVASVAGFGVNDLIVITDGSSAHAFQITAINAGTRQIAHVATSPWNVAPTTPWAWPASGYKSGASIYKIDILSYYVDSTNFRRPTLVRRSYGGQPLVVSYDISKFQMWYRMQDGSLTRTPTVVGTGVALVDKLRPVVYTSLSDATHPTFNDSVWTEVRPRTF